MNEHMMNEQAGASRPTTCMLAVASLICSVLCIAALPAVILGHMAMRRIRESEGRLAGEGVAKAGLVIGYVGLAIWALALVGPSVWPMIQSQINFNKTIECNDNMKVISVFFFAAETGGNKVTNVAQLVPQYLDKEPRCPVNGAAYIADPVNYEEPIRCPNYSRESHRATLWPDAHREQKPKE